MKKIVAILILGVALVWANRAEEFKKGCEAGDPRACYEIGEHRKACELGFVAACELPKNNPEFDAAIKQCEQGHCEQALDNINWNKHWGDRSSDYLKYQIYNRFPNQQEQFLAQQMDHYERIVKETRVLLRKICLDSLNDGVVSMCYKAMTTLVDVDKKGEVSSEKTLLFSDDERNKIQQKINELVELSLQEYDKKCDEGEMEICLILGEALFNGILREWKGIKEIEISKDPTKAGEFFLKACDAGDTYTCKKYELTQDTNRFKAVFKKACDAGNQNACPKLGELYFSESKNTSKDKAKELYQKACDLGSANGCYELAVSYNIGRGVSQDINKAKEIYKKACDLEGKDRGLACENFKRLSK